jgi:predicted nucleic-acid-binding protein
MRITADTNILVRAVVADDKKQAQAAARLLKEAELSCASLPVRVRFGSAPRLPVWADHISTALEALLSADNVAVNRPAVDAGLSVLKAGGDFADGLIAYEGDWLGGDTFVSFDKRTVSLLSHQGKQARLLK